MAAFCFSLALGVTVTARQINQTPKSQQQFRQSELQSEVQQIKNKIHTHPKALSGNQFNLNFESQTITNVQLSAD